jgi:hypothetical protein
MCRYVGIAVYQGLVEEVLIFERETDATAWIAGRRREFGMEETLGSLTWDTKKQLPL